MSYTPEQIENYRETGRIAAEVLTILIDHVKPGVSTFEIAKIAEDLIVNKFEAEASCIGQYDFEYALCSSVNDVVCHGVPSKEEILKEGDVVNLDVTVRKHGLVSDTSRMYLVGEVSESTIEKTQRIIESRVNKCGVSQPNIQKQPISGRLQIELPGAKDKNRIRKYG